MDGKQLKVGVWLGDGEPPGYLWNVGILEFAIDDVMRFLNPDQYHHVALQVKELARDESPSQSATQSVDKIEDYYELREKGGILAKINVRIFFGLDHARKAIIVLGGIKKENEGQTPAGTRITMRRRWRKYKAGDYGFLES